MPLADRCRTIADGAGAAYDDAAGTAFADTLKQSSDALTEAAAEIDRLQTIVAKCYDHLDGGCSDDLWDECEQIWNQVETIKAAKENP